MKKNVEEYESPYCDVCGHCGYIGCCGIRNFIANHIEGKTNCKNESLIIDDLISLCEYKDEVFEENEELQQENKILKENAENNDRVVDKVNWENQLLKKENKQLKLINKEYERLNKENGRGFKITNVKEYNIDELLSYKKYKDNWIKLKEIAKSQSGLKKKCHNGELWFEVDELLETMEELEGDIK